MESVRSRRGLRRAPLCDGNPRTQCIAGSARGDRAARRALRARAARAVAEGVSLVEAGSEHWLDADARRLALKPLSAGRTRAGARGGNCGASHGVFRLSKLRALVPAGGRLAAEKRAALPGAEGFRGPARELVV